MGKLGDLVTKIVLKGQADPSLQKAFQTASKNADSSLNKLKSYGETFGKAMKVATGVAVAGLGASAKSAIDFESAFAGVKKTVDETDTTKYEDLEKSIRDMAKNMPATTTEIAAVAEAAGQLGIKADDISKFTEVMINLGTTTNLSSEEAATAIAKMFNITGTSMQNVDRFGATIVALGNNAATTESDIVNMATRIASSATQVGFTEQQLLALATSLSSVGLEAEAGGTAISTVMTNIDKAVSTNGKTLGTWAETAGMSTAQFKKAWETDAYGAMQKVIQGMGDTSKNGGNLNVLLEELGVTGIRTSDTMKRLSGASELMGSMTDLANKAWDENVALTNEAETRYATTASQIQIFKNRVNDLGISIGSALLPHINNLLDKLNNIDFDAVADKITGVFNFISKHSTGIITIIGLIAGAFAGFKIAGFITTVIQAVSWISKIVKTFGLLKVVMAALGGPVGIVLVVIGALIGAFVALWMKSETFRNFWIGLWNGIKSVASSVGNWLKNFFTVTIPNAWNACVTWFQNGIAKFKAFFTNLGTSIKNGFNTALNFIQTLPSRIWNWLLNTIAKINQWRIQMVAKAMELGSRFISAVVSFFQQLPYKIGYIIGFCIGKVILFGQKLLTFATTKIPQFVNAVINWIRQLPGKIWTWLVNAYQKVIAWGSNMVSQGRAKASQFISAVINFIQTLPGKIWSFLVNAYQRVITWGSNMVSQGRAKASQFISAVINFITQLPGKIWTIFTNAIAKVVSFGAQMLAKGKQAATNFKDAVVNGIKEIPGKVMSVGKDIVTGIWNGIQSAKDWLTDKVKSFASGIVDGIKSALKIGSPSKVMEKLLKWVPIGAGNGVIDNMKYAVNAVKTMGGKMTAEASKINPTISTKVATVGEKLKKFGTGGTVTTPQTAIVGDEPETIVPHGNKPRNRSLLKEAASGVGMRMGGNTTFSVTFAPTITGGNAEENRKMLQEEEAEFERRMDEYFEKKVRLAF